jgi:hypothetical protein
LLATCAMMASGQLFVWRATLCSQRIVCHIELSKVYIRGPQDTQVIKESWEHILGMTGSLSTGQRPPVLHVCDILVAAFHRYHPFFESPSQWAAGQQQTRAPHQEPCILSALTPLSPCTHSMRLQILFMWQMLSCLFQAFPGAALLQAETSTAGHSNAAIPCAWSPTSALETIAQCLMRCHLPAAV